jgi:hippurate hydrolase
LIDLYQYFHEHPELSYHEIETGKRIAEELRSLGAEVTTGVGKTGVVGLLKNGAGPLVLVRTDLDALPITEATGLPYASAARAKNDAGETVGVMHACGHDMHMTCFVGLAKWLVAHKDRWSGTVMFVAQPAEERGNGAVAMLDDRLYERFGKPEAALALHVSHDLAIGRIGIRSGPALASATSVDVTVKGRGGHGAMPHATVDPIVLAAVLVLDLQTIVSREVPPTEPAVITVGSIHGGTKHNIIPAEVKLELTLRAFKEEVRQKLIQGIRRRATALATAHGAPEPVVTVTESTPPTVNTPALVERLVPALHRAIGTENVVEYPLSTGAEDFGEYGRGGVPTFMIRLGTVDPKRLEEANAGGSPLPSLHSPFFYPVPEPSLELGIRTLSSALMELAGSAAKAAR